MIHRSLVTGAAGFIGSHIAAHLLNAGHQVVAVDDLSGGYRENVPSGVSWFGQLDVADKGAMERMFKWWHFDYVFHCAAYAGEGLSHFIRRYNYWNNVIGSVTLINEAIKHDIERFVFTSSMAVYGAADVPYTERTVPLPTDPYGIAKHAVELDLLAAHELFGLDYTIFRPHNVYGEGQNLADRYRNVIAIFMNQLMQGQPMTVFGDGLQTRAFSYIGDVAPVIAHSIQTHRFANVTCNIGADWPYSILELAYTVAKVFGVHPRIVHLPERHEVKHAYSNHERLRELISLPEPVDLQTGLQRMADWAKRIGPRPTRQFTGIEVSMNLPSSWT